jgi:hypothetical protein
MSLRYYYRNNAGTLVELVGQVRRMTLQASASASEGSVGTFELTVDDDDATFDIRGHRRVNIVESAAEGDAYGGVVWAGYTGDRDVFRGPKQVGAERQWTLHLHDVNTILDQRINVGNDHNRPQETDIARVRWILNTNEMGRVENDETYIDQTGGVQMDAVDYRGQKVLDVIDDCAQQSGRNYYLFWLDSGDADPVDIFLWYKHSASSNYTSALRISNDLDDVDQVTTYAPDHEMKLTRSPSRVASGVYQQYDGGSVYETKQLTAERFITRDVTGRGENVKTAATASRRARRYLDEIDTELDTIACSVIVDGGLVNGFMQGHRTFIKATHLPGYSDEFKPMRIRDRTVHEIAPDVYEVAMNLVGPSLENVDTTGSGGGSGADDGTIYAILSGSSGPYPLPDGYLLFYTPGDDISPAHATQGPFEFVAEEDAGGRDAYRGIRVTDTGTVNVVMVASAIGIMWGQRTPYTVTWELLLDDAVVASESIVAGPPPTGTDLALWASWGPTVSVTGLAVSAGSVLSGRLSCVGTDGVQMAGFRSPWGVNPGVNNNRLEITGGSF